MGDSHDSKPERVLVTGARLPVGIELVRKLGRTGRFVLATDSFASAPGLHSRFAEEHEVTASPRDATREFIDDVLRLAEEHAIERLIPTFEEVFFLAAHGAELAPKIDLFAPPLETLAKLHDKASLQAFAQSLGVKTPNTIVARDRAELEAAIAETPTYFARPAFSRGGVSLFTNHGPLAGAEDIDAVEPTAENPLLVQPFVEGEDLCSYSIVHDGRVTAHGTYVHPMTLEHAGGITFESIDCPETLAVTRKLAEATGYRGHMSLDFKRNAEGLFLIECNPRPTSGIALMPDEMFDRGLSGHDGDTLISPAGQKRILSLALLRNMVAHPGSMRENLEALFSGGPDVYADPEDLGPFFFQLLAYGRILQFRLSQGGSSRSDLMKGYFDDLTWDGQALTPTLAPPSGEAPGEGDRAA